MHVGSGLFCFLALAGLTCAEPEEGLRQAVEGVVYRLNQSTPECYQGVNPVQRLTLEFNSDETRLQHPRGDTALRLTGYGYGRRLRTPVKAKPVVSGNRVEYQRGALSEWYVNGSSGLEQGFTLGQRPGVPRDGEPLVIALGVSGGLRPEMAAQGDAVLLRSRGVAVLRYAGLRAWDARGRVLPSRLEAGKREIRLVVQDHGAEYPLVVDPFWTQEAELTASDGAAFNYFGWSVSVSGDTAVVGAYESHGRGAAYVFVRTGTAWAQQQELTASDGAPGDSFGWSVGVSGDTVVVGAYNINSSQGAAYVFVRSGTIWSQQQKLAPSNGQSGGAFGSSVAVSGDTLLVGAYNSNLVIAQSPVYVFTRTGATWSQQQVLTPSDGTAYDDFGSSIAIDGDTAVVGAVGANHGGAAYIFVRNGVTWSQQQELTASDESIDDDFGNSVAVSGDTALVGAFYKTIGSTFAQGAVYVFVRSNGTWSQQQELNASDGAVNDQFGWSVGVSGDTAVVGAWAKTIGSNSYQGAAYVVSRSGTVWNLQQELTAPDGAASDFFGWFVAVSGNTAVVGASNKTKGPNQNQGATYVWRRPYVFDDFSNAGHSGALLYDPSLGQSYTALSTGNGTYQYVPNLFSPGFDTLRTGDFNGDGKADLILYNSQTALAYIGLGNGDGTFDFQSLFWSPGYDTVSTGDLNGDGKTDVALYNGTTGTMYTGISNGDGTFIYTYTLITAGYTALRLADTTGDGKADIFVYRALDGLSSLGIGDGNGSFAFHGLSTSPGYNLVDTGDLDGDGEADIILYNGTNGNAAAGISNGAGGFTFTPLFFGPGFTSVRLAKYTGRVTADVTVYNKKNGAAYFGTGTGTGTFNFQSLFWSPGYDSVVPEDVNGDGKTDIVLYNSTTGTQYTGLSNGDGTFDYTYSYWGIGKLLAQ